MAGIFYVRRYLKLDIPVPVFASITEEKPNFKIGLRDKVSLLRPMPLVYDMKKFTIALTLKKL